MEVEWLHEEALLLRQALYRFCAAGLLYPEPERFKTLEEGAGWLAASLDGPWPSGELRERLLSTCEWLQGLDEFPEHLQGEWINLFGVSRTTFCYPYEGATVEPQWSTALQAALQQEYAAAGLELSVDDLPDHVSVELEYMSYLSGLELSSLERDVDGLRPMVVDRQRAFLTDHLCRWLPGLTERVKAAEGGIFVDFCLMAELLTTQEQDRLASFSIPEKDDDASAGGQEG